MQLKDVISLSFGTFFVITSLTSCSTIYSPEIVKQPKIKNIILMIGDGMGPQQVGLLEEYATRAPNSIYKGDNSAIAKLANAGVTGLSLHGPADKLVVDSACSATQLATGLPAGNEMIGLTRAGYKAPTILEKAKSLGKATGLVSDTRLTHATPAAFATHLIHRSMENEIAEQMVRTGVVDVMLSGGLRHFIPKNYRLNEAFTPLEKQLKESEIVPKSKRRDQKNLLFDANKNGYDLAFTKTQMFKTDAKKLLGLFANSAMANGIDTSYRRVSEEPSLRDMTQKAIDILSQNENGFFLMIEGGQIDWAGHNNDAGTLLHEMIKFDNAIEAVFNWAKGREDTLVIVTADHETGGFGFSYSGENLPESEVLSNPAQDIYQPNYNFGDLSILDTLYEQKKSFAEMWHLAKGNKNRPSPLSLVSIVNLHSTIHINEQDAKSILAEQKNEFFKRGHKSLGKKVASKINDFTPFYVYLEERPLNLIGRAMSTKQNIVWSTGTHTHTPVGVFVFGPEHTVKKFNGLHTHVELGKKMQRIFDFNVNNRH
ncbi:alkaline phosphatase [Pseudoalteromonas aurantia]|uniref:Alkaline phosphatase n=1 Tax=Pseudoalteromonas aurantia TaxID=43654 RepID=A0ABY2VS09_9GAMM|nr:alkaline phosphatase [Pseudoalteromonas aurantia]TMO57397.1 alkaline phosphatase [Pseudoalteromonas aurantia]TMO69205.1 alkaline phosphatase [Pseudoalteromonas aurantia]